MQVATSQTKVCPFCAETILSAAVKCRYCGEFLNTGRARAVAAGRFNPPAAGNQGGPQGEAAEPGEVLYAGQPSLWAMAGAMLEGALVLAGAVFLMWYHIERLSMLSISAQRQEIVGKYRLAVGVGVALAVVVVVAYKAMKLKMTHYEVTADRIEYSRGILDRQVDNLDMFRIKDIKLRRSPLDCIVGVGTVILTTSDQTDPEFVFEKVRDARLLYDVIKKGSLQADRRASVVHLE